jgi:dipeptidase D
MSIDQEILNIFQQVAAIPRPSQHEQLISGWLQNWAARHGFKALTDEAGNLLIRVSATSGYENAPTIILQGHMDMVCEKTPDSQHNFTKDPIRCVIEGEWLHADNTTLGADNGIAIALAIALVENPEIVHPALELLFTVEEEIGLSGAMHLQNGFVNGKILVNLDSEAEGVFIVGCAGGTKSNIDLQLNFLPIKGKEKAYKIMVNGLRGGHSGVDINKNRASAIKLIARFLGDMAEAIPLRIADVRGGSAHNAIAREAQATILIDEKDKPELDNKLATFQQALNDEFIGSENFISFSLADAQAKRAATDKDSQKIVALLQALPHGVFKMSKSIEGFVETSNNFAILEMKDDELMIVSSQRSMLNSQLAEITRRISAIARLSGAQVFQVDNYPAWKPNLNSPLLVRSCKIYEQLFNTPARIETIHAGLECGQIGEIYEGMDMISMGATICDAHSPQERLYIPSLLKIWEFLVELLRSYTIDEKHFLFC